MSEALVIVLMGFAAASAPAPPPGACGSALALASSAAPENRRGFVEYVPLRDGRAQPGAPVRLQWVEAEWEGARRLWIELWFDRAGRTALRVRADGGGAALMKLNRAVFAIDAPTRGTQLCRAPPPRDLGPAVRLRTAAGGLAARRLLVGGGRERVEIWMSPQVPVTAMARIRFPNGDGWEVAAMGPDAKTAFPADFSAAPLPSLAGALDGAVPR